MIMQLEILQVHLHKKLALPLQVHRGNKLEPVYLNVSDELDIEAETASDFVRIR